MRFITAALAVLAPMALFAASAPAAASGEGAGAVHLVAMDEASVPIVDGARADGVLTFRLVFEARDEAAAHAITAEMPALRATALGAGLEFAHLYASPMMPVDARRLASDLTAALQAQDHAIDRVLLVDVRAAQA